VRKLNSLLQNRHWLRCNDPFPHLTARDVFIAGFRDELIDQVRSILAKGISQTSEPDRFGRGIKGYDAYGLSFSPDVAGALSIFVSRAWHDLLAAATDVAVTGHIHAGLHYHAVGSASGTVHNDLNPGWFAEAPAVDDVRVARHDLCCYKLGSALQEGVSTHETVRAVAAIYYFNNEHWQPGDGGETGLYRNADTPVDAPAKRVPPLDNSLLVFECTPYSYHAFLANQRHARTSMIMWLHREPAAVIGRWGAASIVRWSSHGSR
jgi:hypothetical protein